MAGLLVYIMGPSGAGKDSLIDAARPRLAAAGVSVARRVITRSAESVGEQAMGVTPAEFAERSGRGEFALQWQANGLDYGIPVDLRERLAKGESVLVNGSRAHLPTALAGYPHLLPILVSVDPSVLRERLLRRGRESPAEIEQRLQRNARLAGGPIEGLAIEVLDNSSDLDSAVLRLMQVLQRYGISAAADRT